MARARSGDPELDEILTHYGFTYALDRMCYTDGKIFIGDNDLCELSRAAGMTLATAFETLVKRIRGTMDLFYRFPWNWHDADNPPPERTTMPVVGHNTTKQRVHLKGDDYRKKPLWL